MIYLAQLLLALLALPALAAGGYLLLLTLLSARLPPVAAATRRLRFEIVIPAHNEAAVIEKTFASLRQLDWPLSGWRVRVVADNCTDNTAALARAAGAQVLERCDAALRGKGYALRMAFDRSRAEAWADAIVVVDADTQVSANLLQAFAARIEAGAAAIQANYGVLNPAESWRTSLLAIAHGAFHVLRSRARERRRLSCGIRGNGWCITQHLLDVVPYCAYSATEDLEYGIALGLAGYRVHYADDAWAKADMESSEAVARGQRQRWEDGRFALLRSQLMPLLRMARLRRSWVCFDLALDLLVLPLSYVALNVFVLIAAAASLALWHTTLPIWLWSGLVSAACLTLYVLRGWQLSGRGAAGLFDLLRAPFFILWKLLTLLRRHDRRDWTPTQRRPQHQTEQQTKAERSARRLDS